MSFDNPQFPSVEVSLATVEEPSANVVEAILAFLRVTTSYEIEAVRGIFAEGLSVATFGIALHRARERAREERVEFLPRADGVFFRANDEQKLRRGPRSQVYEFDGERKTLSEWAEARGIPKAALYYRMKTLGLPIDRALAMGRSVRNDTTKGPTPHGPFGEALRAARVQSEVKLRELAEKLDVSVPFLSDVERGRRSLSDERIRKAAKFLRADLTRLLEIATRDRGTVVLRFDKQVDPKLLRAVTLLSMNWPALSPASVAHLLAAFQIT